MKRVLELRDKSVLCAAAIVHHRSSAPSKKRRVSSPKEHRRSSSPSGRDAANERRRFQTRGASARSLLFHASVATLRAAVAANQPEVEEVAGSSAAPRMASQNRTKSGAESVERDEAKSKRCDSTTTRSRCPPVKGRPRTSEDALQDSVLPITTTKLKEPSSDQTIAEEEFNVRDGSRFTRKS